MNSDPEIVRVDHDGAKPVVSGSFGLADFRSDFAHCSSTADLFAQLVGSAMGAYRGGADDLSTVLNELLEWGFRSAADEGEMVLRVTEVGSALRLCLSLPMPIDSLTSVVARVSELDPERAKEYFVLELAKPMQEASPLLGLYWLAGEYGHLRALSDRQSVLQLALELQP